MNKVKYIVLFFTVIFSFAGCDKDPKYLTSHPEEGGINLTMDWSNAGTQTPESYQAYVVSSAGGPKLFEGLRGNTNNLVVPPGDATVYVFNVAENISRSEGKATISNTGSGISHNPGLFYSWSGPVFTERDRDITQMASMKRQTGELKLSIAIKPASMIDKVKSVSAVLDGAASVLDMKTNEVSTPSSINTILTKSSYYATTTIRTFGFISSANKNLRLEIEMENGNTTSVTSELTSFLEGFNTSKEKLFTLNADMYVSDNASRVTVDNWSANTESRYLSASTTEIKMSHNASKETITVATDQSSWVYSVIQSGGWLTVNENGNVLELSAKENDTDEERKATINISAGGLTESVTITQDKYSSGGSYYDEEVVKLQSATVGKGIIIVLMGDGYTIDDMTKKTGKYESDMRLATDHFFSVYPMSEYRNHFDVYMVAAISNEKGISNKYENKTVDNRFESIMNGGGETRVVCDYNIVVDYLNVINDLPYGTSIDDITVIMPINENVRAGTCLWFNPMDNIYGYGEGFSLCMIPTYYKEFRELIVHESAGHAFAKVTDEYVYSPNETIPDEIKERIKRTKEWGWCENVDFSSNILNTSWKGFANNSKYIFVRTFEGAETYGKGIWRPEYNSCMNDNVLYFNAPTRWAQVRRIKRLAGISYSFSQFLQDDVVPAYPTSTRSERDNFKPFDPPIMMKFDKSKINSRFK